MKQVYKKHKAIDRRGAMEEVMDDLIGSNEFFNYFCGEFIGGGHARNVFEYIPDKRWVIKIETGNTISNALEYNLWNHVEDVASVSKWLAPVKNLSHNNRIMLQRRCKPIYEVSKLPKRVPAFFTDLHMRNWGLLDGKVVCFDYANHLMLENGMTLKMRTPKWEHM